MISEFDPKNQTLREQVLAVMRTKYVNGPHAEANPNAAVYRELIALMRLLPSHECEQLLDTAAGHKFVLNWGLHPQVIMECRDGKFDYGAHAASAGQAASSP